MYEPFSTLHSHSWLESDLTSCTSISCGTPLGGSALCQLPCRGTRHIQQLSTTLSGCCKARESNLAPSITLCLQIPIQMQPRPHGTQTRPMKSQHAARSTSLTCTLDRTLAGACQASSAAANSRQAWRPSAALAFKISAPRCCAEWPRKCWSQPYATRPNSSLSGCEQRGCGWRVCLVPGDNRMAQH